MAILTIPPDIRHEMKEPFGLFIPDTEADHERLSRALGKQKLVVVGDATALRVFAEGFRPDVAVVDMKTKRKRVIEFPQGFTEAFNVKTHVTNPEGTLTDDLFRVIGEAMNAMGRGERTLVIVTGEEDLAFLPCILDAPQDTVVLYGLPDRGIVVSEPTEKRRTFIRDALKRMEA